MTDKLKPCPFCGGNNVGVFKHEYFYKSHLYAAHCYDCHFGLKMVETEEEAITTWNTRKPMDRIVEQLEKASYDSMHLDMSRPMTETWQIVDLDDAIDIVKGEQ